MMYFKRTACAVLSSMLMLSGLCVNAQAAEMSLTGPEMVETVEFQIQRATNRFDLTIGANSYRRADTSFSLEKGETVRITASYSPAASSVDFGLESSDGSFHGVNVKNGSIDKTIQVSQTGKYRFVIRNRSNSDIEVSGYVRY